MDVLADTLLELDSGVGSPDSDFFSQSDTERHVYRITLQSNTDHHWANRNTSGSLLDL
jgi:hypothetical protein